MTAEIWFFAIGIGITAGSVCGGLIITLARKRIHAEIESARTVIPIAKSRAGIPVLNIFDGATVPIEPAEALDIFDEVLERSKRSPTTKLVLRFEIWPAASPQWLASVLTSTSNSNEKIRHRS